VPLEALVEKFSHTRFEPSGFTKNPEVPYAKSITDYIFRWLAAKFLSAEHQEAVGVQTAAAAMARSEPVVAAAEEVGKAGAFRSQSDAPSCHYCGNLMMRNGACYRCANCGSTSGCS
jgi:ribonucleoside-diphosphate reductase alpha chain